MKASKLLYLISALILSSCNSYFDPEGLNPEEKLVLYCMPNPNQDSIIIQLSKSVPVTMTGTPPLGIPNADISVLVNGEPQQVHWNEERTDNLPPQCYYVLNRFKEGDNIEILAESKGFNPVSSATTIPKAFPVEDINLVLKPGIDTRLQFQIKFRDEASSVDYYGIRLVERVVTDREVIDENGELTQTVSEMTAVLSPDITEEPLINNRVGLDATFELDYNYYQNLYIWTDEEVSGREYTLRLNATYTPDYDSEMNGTVETAEKVIIKHYYKVQLYRLSPELYRYLKSVNDISNNELGQNGLAPIRSHYTNILNGFGILGACQITESQWLPNCSENEGQLR